MWYTLRSRASSLIGHGGIERGTSLEGWLFPSDSKCGHLTTVAKSFRTARKRAGLPNTVVLYSARHTFAADLLGECKTPAVTMKPMGHASENQ
jgi:integrase